MTWPGGRLTGPAVLLMCAALTGCAPPSESAPDTTLTVLAASSLTATFGDLADRYEDARPGTDVVLAFGSSSGLARQILEGAPGDIFASANDLDMRRVVAGGRAASPVRFASNVAQIAVWPGSSRRVSSVADLSQPGLKVALCQPDVPCGRLARTVLAEAGVDVRPVTLGLDVKGTLAPVVSGEVDAAIVYATDVQAAGRAVRGVVVPPQLNTSTAYVIAPIEGGRSPEAATAFVDFIRSPTGQRVLADAGFGPP